MRAVFIFTCFGLLAQSAAAIDPDVNEDGRFDCADVDVISAAFFSDPQDLAFDFNGNGRVDYDDVIAGVERQHINADINFDGVVDRTDLHTYGLNWQQHTTSYCQGDVDLSGFVDANDQGSMGVNWGHSVVDIIPEYQAAQVDLIPAANKLAPWRDGGHVFATSGPFEYVAIPQRTVDGLLATKLVIQTKDSAHRISTFDGVQITGDVHQVGLSVFGGVLTTPFGIAHLFSCCNNIRSSRVALEWNSADSHILIQHRDIGAGAGGAFSSLDEENNESSDVLLAPLEDNNGFVIPATTGFGQLENGFISNQNSDLFFLNSGAISNVIEFAQLVTPAVGSEGVFLRVGIQAGDADRKPVPYTDILGLDELLQIPFYSQPCDINEDGMCSDTDLTLLMTAVVDGTENADWNLDGSDSTIITQADITAWHSWVNPIPGDTDRDGDVDAVDLNNLGRHWQINTEGFEEFASWEDGDFNSDNVVDVLDLNALGVNWQVGVPTDVENAAVPEPHGELLMLCALVYFLRYGRQRHRRRVPTRTENIFHHPDLRLG